MTVSTIHVLAASIVAKGETAKIRIWHNPAAIANMSVLLINNNGLEIDITPTAVEVSSGTLNFVEASYTFPVAGDFTVYATDTVTADWGVAHIRVAQWAANMDLAVSTIRKQSTETSRLRNDIDRARFKPPKGG